MKKTLIDIFEERRVSHLARLDSSRFAPAKSTVSISLIERKWGCFRARLRDFRVSRQR